jgi:uncharacterized protein YbbC (DUF1343 family)
LTSCAQESTEIKVSAERTELYVNLLKGKNIAIVANQTSVIKNNKNSFTHLVDSLLSLNLNITKVFSPEHGFRGKADAGAHIEDGVDTKTGLPILSLHGKSKKPSAKQLKNIDVVVFDIQDVGVRFYTYISTLHYVMEACAENNIPLIVLDRPNPNGHYIDGPVLEPEHSSFVGKHPVPVVYGMTIGEYGQMINGEKWLKNGVQCDLTVIPLKNYNHNSTYSLPIKPSPNLPNDKSINLYPSLGFFEGTTINAGRGTSTQFQMYGAPFFKETNFSYKPKANDGAKYPKHKNKLCYGVDLRKNKHLNRLDLSFLIDAYKRTPKNQEFFGKTFTIHAGTKKLQQQLEKGISEKEIRKSWQKDLEKYKKTRTNYLIYK